MQDDIDSHVVNTFSKFKLITDTEIMKQFAILYHDQFVKVVKMIRPGYVPYLLKM